MSEYIEREVLLSEIAKMTIVPEDLYVYGIIAGIDVVKKKVFNVPAADVAPVVHSYWRHGNCAMCGLYVGETTSRFFHYCPHCGARMDGDGNG